MREDSAPLGIADTNFAIDLKLNSAPAGLMHRELVINGLENEVAPGETKRIVRFYVDDNGKVAIINNGKPMDADTLVKITDLNFSTKKMGLHGRENRGEGAKVASLKFNRLGMRFRSGTIDSVAEVTVLQDDGQWVRRREWVGDDETGSYEEAVGVNLDGSDDSVTAQEIDRYKDMKGPFTEVLLCGNYEGQNTGTDSYGEHVEHPKQAIGNWLFARFYRLPQTFDKDGKVVKSIVQFDGDSFRGGQKWRNLITISELPKKYPDKFLHADERFVDLPNGIRVEYLCSTLDEKSRTPYNQVSLGLDACRAGLVWNDEIYDLHEGPTWMRSVVEYGLYSLSRKVSVFVHLPLDYCTPDGYRERISRDNVMLTLHSFSQMIHDNRPVWLRNMITVTKNPASKSVEDALKKIAAKIFDTKRGVKKAKASKTAPKLKMIMGGKSGGGGGGTTHGGGTKRGPNTENPTPRGGPGGEEGRRRSRPAVVSKGDEASNTSGTGRGVPTVVWRTGGELDDLPQLVGRGAYYVGNSEPVLYLNADYPMLNDIMDDLFTHYNFLPSAREEIAGIMHTVIKDHIAIKIGTGLLMMLNKRGSENWPIAAVTAAITPEALTLLFDVSGENADMGAMSSKIRRQSSYRKAMAAMGHAPTADNDPEMMAANG